jgi:hypothetical protein
MVRRWFGIGSLVLSLSLLFAGLAAGQGPGAVFLPNVLVDGPAQTPTPVPPPASLVVQNDQLYIDTVNGGLHLAGEIRNNTASTQSLLRVTVRLLQGSQVVREFQQSALVFSLRPGEAAPFDVFMGTPPPFDSYTATPSGQATANAPVDQFTILSQRAYDEAGMRRVVGELRNDLISDNAGLVQVVATFYDANGKVWRASQTYTLLNVLRPGQRSPFVLAASGAGQIASASFLVRAIAVTAAPRDDLAVLNSSAAVQGEALLIGGQVRNNGASGASNVQVVASLYDAGGQIVNAAASTRAPLAAGATAPFQIAFPTQWQGYASYELQVQGN